jgi:glutathione S-transferase
LCPFAQTRNFFERNAAGGKVMTESAAILIWLADRYLDAVLAPLPSDERRSAFLRRFEQSCEVWDYIEAGASSNAEMAIRPSVRSLNLDGA